MKVEFIFIGKTTEKWIEAGCENYITRIKRYVNTEIKVISAAPSGTPPDQQMKKEAESVIEKISSKDHIILLEEMGKQFTSKEFSGQVDKFMCSGKSKIVFIIGGAFGSDKMLKERADLLLSCSKMTFTHQMIRVILLEQVYRAFTILKNEKYHH